MAVEVVPSRVDFVSPLLASSYIVLLIPAGLVSLAMVRRRWSSQHRGGACWWVASLVEHVPLSLISTGAVTPMGATIAT
jgi:uncharacterized membrane protein